MSWLMSIFPFSFVAIFWRFLPSNPPIMLYNIRYWCFFFSLGNLINKIPCVSQNTEVNNLPAAVHSADCRFDSRMKWWIHVSSIVTYLRKNHFCCVEIVANNVLIFSTHCCFWSTESKRGTHFEHSFLNDKYSCKMINTLSSDILTLLSHSTSI